MRWLTLVLRFVFVSTLLQRGGYLLRDWHMPTIVLANGTRIILKSQNLISSIRVILRLSVRLDPGI
jgi:hypothetical protein